MALLLQKILHGLSVVSQSRIFNDCPQFLFLQRENFGFREGEPGHGPDVLAIDQGMHLLPGYRSGVFTLSEHGVFKEVGQEQLQLLALVIEGPYTPCVFQLSLKSSRLLDHRLQRRQGLLPVLIGGIEGG